LVNLSPTTLSSPPRVLSTDESSGGRSGSGSGSTTISREMMSNTIVARDNDHTSSPHPPSPVMVAIICDAKSLSTLGPVVLETWTRNLPYDFRFFTGEAEYITTPDGEKIESNKTLIPKALRPYTIRLEAPDGYPPRKKELTMFKHLHDHFLVNHAQYSWYMKVDIDSYLNGAELEKVVKRLVASGTTKGYIGNPGLGREFERHSLGLNGPFCMGFGYLMGRETLVQLRPKLDWCLAHPHSEHSDTEMGNCIYKTSKTTCQHPNLPKDEGQKFVNYYFNYGQDGLVTNAKVESNSSNQQIHSNQAIYFGTPLQAVLVHALKKPADMRKLHQQLTRNLRPTFAAPWMQFKDKNANATTTYSLSGAHNNRTQMPPELVESAAAKQMDRFLATACVNNPLVQLHSQENGFLLPECEPPMQPHRGPTNTSPVHMTRSDIPTIPTYVLNLPHRREEFEAMAQKFANSTSLNLTRFEAINGVELYSQESMPQIRGEGYRRMKPGEQGYRMSMRVLLQKGEC
jgi:Chondroitin N-acetylgalactosaminyltransferase